MPVKNTKNKYSPVKLFVILGLILLITVDFAFLYYKLHSQKRKINELKTQVTDINNKQSNFEQNFENQLFVDHLKLMQEQKLESTVEQLNHQIASIVDENENNQKVAEIYKNYDDFSKKMTRNKNVNLKVEDIETKVNEWGPLLLKKDYDTLSTSISDEVKNLDSEYDKYIASLPKPSSTTSGKGYSFVTIDTERGKFTAHLIKLPYSGITVKTVSANQDSCKDNCPTKSLADYVKENDAYAGINGSYFCPPDYASCSGKVNSFDYAFYNSNNKKWLNKDALTWFKTGLITFNGSSGKFYSKSSDYDGGSVTGAISNYPSLLKGGEVIIDLGELTSYQKDSKSNRGAIGLGGDNIYLAIVNRATVIDTAYVMKALGAKDALNIDGGGSSALYINGGYVVGPGRSLPNAVIIKN